MSRASSGVLVAIPVLSLLLLSAGASAQGGSAEGKKLKNPVKSTPESITAGAGVFRKNCAFCHGTDAKGNGPLAPKGTTPSDLTTGKFTNGSTDGELFVTIRDGVGPKFDMKPNKDKIPDQDIWNIVNYLRSLKK